MTLSRVGGQILVQTPLLSSEVAAVAVAPFLASTSSFTSHRRQQSVLASTSRWGGNAVDDLLDNSSFRFDPRRKLKCRLTTLASTPSTTLSSSRVTTNNSCLHGLRLCSSVALASFEHGLVHLSVPLPSRDENCRFTIKPISSTVGDFLDALKAEDRGIESAGIYTEEGVRIAGSTPIHSVLNQEFDLRINDKKVDIQGLEEFRTSFEAPVEDRLSEVKKLVAQLHSSLNITDHQLLQESQLEKQLETLKSDLEPMEERRKALEEKSHARTKRLTWLGLGLMGIQFGFLARLTWWEYSWDVMEPVTYFVTYGTVMGMYAYYCVTRQEYEFSAAYDRENLKWFHKRAKKVEFNVEDYNKLRESITQVEADLRRLRDPLQKNLPIAQPK